MGSCPRLIEDSQAVRRHFDLSQNKSLRTLKTTAASIIYAGDTASDFLKTVLSTVTSPLPIDIVITYQDTDVDLTVWPWERPYRVRSSLPEQMAENGIHHQERFRVFSEMYRVRKFRLVLCANVLYFIAERAMRVLEGIVEVERRKGRLDYLPCKPVITSEIRSPSKNILQGDVGFSGGNPIYSNAL